MPEDRLHRIPSGGASRRHRPFDSLLKIPNPIRLGEITHRLNPRSVEVCPELDGAVASNVLRKVLGPGASAQRVVPLGNGSSSSARTTGKHTQQCSSIEALEGLHLNLCETFKAEGKSERVRELMNRYTWAAASLGLISTAEAWSKMASVH